MWVIRDEYEEFSKREESFKKESPEKLEKLEEKVEVIITEDIDDWIRESTESLEIKDNDKEENLECKICENKGYDEENCAERKEERFQKKRKTDWKKNIEKKKNDTDELEKIREILNLGEHEIWNENIKKMKLKTNYKML
ncbi:hypothetical protein C1645_731472 [Glomus cerebriforme]|uniref:Uncharacterized protein n=1 Tax=Glomus cerebriforme TaxID=658196 RepID=A0A397TV33_9GLOM|nr:hypothetical protein C1645_731472 [Glomus cerebriforme]